MGQFRPGLNLGRRELLPKDLGYCDFQLFQHCFQSVQGQILLRLLKSLKGAATQTSLPGEVTKRHFASPFSEELAELMT